MLNFLLISVLSSFFFFICIILSPFGFLSFFASFFSIYLSFVFHSSFRSILLRCLIVLFCFSFLFHIFIFLVFLFSSPSIFILLIFLFSHPFFFFISPLSVIWRIPLSFIYFFLFDFSLRFFSYFSCFISPPILVSFSSSSLASYCLFLSF